MKLPVPFSAFALVTDQLHSAHALIREMASRHDRELDRAEKRFAELMASYRMLKLQGAVDTTPPPRAEPATIDPVEQAIREECAGKDAEVVRQMRRQVAEDRKTMDDEQVIALIRRGNRPADEMAAI